MKVLIGGILYIVWSGMFRFLESVFLFLAHLISVCQNHPTCFDHAESSKSDHVLEIRNFSMERNLSGVIISISTESDFDDRMESFHLFVCAEDKMCDEGCVVRIVEEMRRVAERSGDNSDGVEKMRRVVEVMV